MRCVIPALAAWLLQGVRVTDGVDAIADSVADIGLLKYVLGRPYFCCGWSCSGLCRQLLAGTKRVAALLLVSLCR